MDLWYAARPASVFWNVGDPTHRTPSRKLFKSSQSTVLWLPHPWWTQCWTFIRQGFFDREKRNHYGNCSIFIEKIERLFTVLESTIFSRQNDKSTRPLMKLSKLNMRTLERERMRKKWRLPGRKSHLILFAFFPLLGISSVRMTQTQTNTQEMMKDHTVYFMLPLEARHISNTLSGVSVFSRCIEPRLNWAE